MKRFDGPVRPAMLALIVLTLALLGGCKSGGQSGGFGTGSDPVSQPDISPDCTGSCAGPASFLTVADVTGVLNRAAAEAAARGVGASIAVVDRVGNVLGVIAPGGVATNVTIASGRPVVGGLEGVTLQISNLAAIAKAITGAYLSSEGNAFSTRTASQIVQEHFNPGELGQPGGPLFGVQFSQLPCGDLVLQGAAVGVGPKRSPLGLAADAGGFPLYKNGTPVGGIGVIADGLYSLDLNVGDVDVSVDELVALAGTVGFEAPESRLADRITVEGKTLRYSDALRAGLLADPSAAPGFAASGMALVPADSYFGGAIVAGTAFGQALASVPAANFSGIVPADSVNATFTGLDAFVLVNAAGVPRFPPIAAPDGLLTQPEVVAILTHAMRIANRARAQIRRPGGTQARVTISLVDTNGTILGIVRTRDAPVFGTDVSLQKARTATFFSRADAAARLTAAGAPFAAYVAAVQAFVDQPGALSNGIAFSDRAGGNLSRPFFPDGDNTSPASPGPFSKPFAGQWSPFNVGLQLDLIAADFTGAIAALGITDCNGSNAAGGAGIDAGRLANGIQIFPGSVPVYKGATLAGGIGVSGDGIDQDDMVSFLGLHDAGVALGTVNNAAPLNRADTITVTVGGTPIALRYVQCPFAPFLDSNEQNPCNGK